MNELRWELATGVPGLERLAADWRWLSQRVPEQTHVHLWEWHRCLLAHLHPAPDDALYAVARRGGEPVAIHPLERRSLRVGGIPCTSLALPTHDHMAYADFLIAPGAFDHLSLAGWLDALASLLGSFDAIVLEPVLEDAAVSALVRRGGAATVTEPSSHSDALPTGPYDDRLDRLSKNFRANLRKARNKLARVPGVEVDVARAPAALATAFEQLLEVEASGWKGRDGTGTAIALDEHVRGFYRELIDRLGPHGGCEIRILRAAGKPIAGQLSILNQARVYVLKIGYDEQHAALAPGNMLLEHLLKGMAGHPTIRHVDLVTSAAWHVNWAPEVRRVVRHFVFSSSVRGHLAWAVLQGKQALRPLRQRLRRARAAAPAA